MRLRNKKTGEIVAFGEGIVDLHQIGCNNVAEMMDAGWEDVPEEPKDFWFIDADGKVKETTYLTEADRADLKNFGNHFESQEEAENAAKKLQAWKRLKDKGFKFTGVTKLFDGDWNKITFNKDQEETWIKDNKADLDLLFGGEE